MYTPFITNIYSEESTPRYYNKLGERKNDIIPSNLIKKLILVVLQSSAFKFGNSIHLEIKKPQREHQ